MLNVIYGVLAMVPHNTRCCRLRAGVTSLSGAERQHRTACMPNMLTHLLIRKDQNDA
jgi:hypothetical protein